MVDLDFALFILTRSDFPMAFCKALTSLASVPTTSYCPPRNLDAFCAARLYRVETFGETALPLYSILEAPLQEPAYLANGAGVRVFDVPALNE